MKITVLGCGSSSGVPVIGCACKTCNSENPKNKRTRCSILIETKEGSILVDTSPDLRCQALCNGVNKVDAILYTHDHADHIHGIDDVRSFNYLQNSIIPIYADTQTLASLKHKFAYAFLSIPQDAWYRPGLAANEIILNKLIPFSVLNTEVIPFYQMHGKTHSLGFRLGNFAYSTDFHDLPADSKGLLYGLDIWIVDCLRYGQTPSHMHLEATLQLISEIRPKRAILTHMSHEFDYDELYRQLPLNVEPAYDGMQIVLEIN